MGEQQIDSALLDRFGEIIGAKNMLVGKDDMATFMREWRDKYIGQAAAVLLPSSVEEVAAILKLAHETKTAIVPQGGNTGLVGGQIPDQTGKQIVLSLKRLDRVRSSSKLSGTMTVEAGVTLLDVQQRAQELGLMFPLSIASEGSAQIGGILATNAGGVQVFKYGMARELVLGLEVVLAGGEILDGLNELRKDNTGYDLKQMFIGSEGTLGVITAAVLKLHPLAQAREIAFVGYRSLRDLERFFEFCRSRAPDALCMFEIMPRIGIEFVTKHKPGARDPLTNAYPWYGLVELEGRQDQDIRPLFESILEEAHGKALIGDAVLASSEVQKSELIALREFMSEAQKFEGGSIKHDISVPVAGIPAFIGAANALVEQLVPGARPVPFGHYGDGNIHYNISQPEASDKQAFLEQWERVSGEVYALVVDFGGSISAEHGIGVMKRDLLCSVKTEAEIALMRKIKTAFDPHNIMNPGKVL